jgi:hypothetical protein
MSLRRPDVIDQLLRAMTRRDAAQVKEVLVRCQPTRAEIDAACDLRRLDLALGVGGPGSPGAAGRGG